MVFLCLICTMVYGQDAIFSNILDKSQYDNPAFASSQYTDDHKGQVSFKHRDQWNRVAANAYSSTFLEADYKLYGTSLDSWSGGMILLNDVSQNAVFKTNNVTLFGSYSRVIQKSRSSKQSVALGAGIGYNSTNLNTSTLWFGRQYDQQALTVNTELSNGEEELSRRNSFVGLDLGLSWNYESKKIKSEFAVSAAHLNDPALDSTLESETIGRRVSFLASFSYKGSRYTTHSLSVKGRNQQSAFQAIPYYSLEYSLRDSEDITMTVGTGLRLVRNIDNFGAESLIVAMGLRATRWTATISYDYNVSDLNFFTRGGGAFEFSLGYRFASDY